MLKKWREKISPSILLQRLFFWECLRSFYEECLCASFLRGFVFSLLLAFLCFGSVALFLAFDISSSRVCSINKFMFVCVWCEYRTLCIRAHNIFFHISLVIWYETMYDRCAMDRPENDEPDNVNGKTTEEQNPQKTQIAALVNFYAIKLLVRWFNVVESVQYIRRGKNHFTWKTKKILVLECPHHTEVRNADDEK